MHPPPTSGPMPPDLARQFTAAELAVSKIIGNNLRRSGVCVLALDAIAVRAGVSRTSAQNAIRLACRLGMLVRQERRRKGANSLSNVMRVADRGWTGWLRLRLSGSGLRSLSTTDTRGFQESERSAVQASEDRPNRRSVLMEPTLEPTADPSARLPASSTQQVQWGPFQMELARRR